MRKLLACFLLLAALGYGVYTWLFARGERIYSQLPAVKAGMSRAAVRTLLGAPDTTYAWSAGPFPQVMHYEMGPGAPDAVREFLDHDTVTNVMYNQ